MKQLDFATTVDALVKLKGTDLLVRVDALVDACMVGFDLGQAPILRRELAREFLTAAPFTELSYRIWRRIGREDQGDGQEAPLEFRCQSQRFLPTVDFVTPMRADAATIHRR